MIRHRTAKTGFSGSSSIDTTRVSFLRSGLLARLESADAGWRARAAVADVRHERWVYRASYENGQARIAPERVAQAHPFARLAPCENALILHSEFYKAAPLTVAGWYARRAGTPIW